MRYLLIFACLALTLFYTSSVLAIPDMGYVVQPLEDGMRVASVFPSHPAADLLQPDDLVLAVNGVSTDADLPLFTNGQGIYIHQVRRGGQELTVPVPGTPRQIDTLLLPLSVGLTATASVLVAGVALLFAGRRHRGAWLFALTTAGLGLGLAASEASLYNVATAGVVLAVLTPLAAVGFIEFALLPWQDPASYRRHPVLLILYLLAAGVGIYTLYRMLQPGAYTPWPVYGLVAAALLANLALLVYRTLRLPPSPARRQALILLVFTGLAVLPLVLLSLLPRYLWGAPLLPWEFSFLLLLLLPLAYLYVMLRGRLLGLDIFVSKALTLFLIGLLGITAFALLLRLTPAAAPPMQFWLGSLAIAGSVFVGIPLLGRPMGYAVDSLIFGAADPAAPRWQGWTAELARNPERKTLQQVFQSAAGDLEISRAGFYHRNDQGRWECLASVRLEAGSAGVLPPTDLAQPLLRRAAPDHAFFRSFPWAELVIPFRTMEGLRGLFLLGPRLGDGIYHDHHIEALRQLGDAMTISLDLVDLYEALRIMVLQLMQAADRQRRHLSYQLHDEPLQRITRAIRTLSEIPDPSAPVVAGLQELQQASRQLRQICAGLRPPLLDQGIHLAIVDVIDRFGEGKPITVHLDVDVAPETVLPEAVTAATYHILQEALENISKHAHASEAWVSLRYEGGRLRLVVEDDGRGCDALSLQRADLLRGHHFGIAGMYDRADDVGGTLATGRSARGGLLIRFEAPLPIPYDGRSHAAMAATMPDLSLSN